MLREITPSAVKSKYQFQFLFKKHCVLASVPLSSYSRVLLECPENNTRACQEFVLRTVFVSNVLSDDTRV